MPTAVFRSDRKQGIRQESDHKDGARHDDDGEILSHTIKLVYTNFQYSIAICGIVNHRIAKIPHSSRMPKSTHTQEDYLRALYLLSGASSDGTVTLSDLAEKLGLRKPTVTQRIESLARKKWVTRKHYGPIRLTTAGRRLAENLTYKHRVVELFLCEVLHMKKDDVHAEAHQLEHAVSDAVIVRMAKHLRNPTHGPHGEVLPEFRPE